MATASPATYGLLGQLATRSWTGYELTQQIRRSLRFIWPVSEAHLYREQRRLVKLGWATVTKEPAGKRTRNRYAITDEGRAALREWVATEPEEPHVQIEGGLRLFYGDQADPATLAATLRATGDKAAGMVAELLSFVDEYLEEGGPLDMLEEGVAADGEQRTFRGRPMFPERLHVVAMSLDLATRLHATMASFFEETAAEVATWPSPTDSSLTAATRLRLESIRRRHSRLEVEPTASEG